MVQNGASVPIFRSCISPGVEDSLQQLSPSPRIHKALLILLLQPAGAKRKDTHTVLLLCSPTADTQVVHHLHYEGQGGQETFRKHTIEDSTILIVLQ